MKIQKKNEQIARLERQLSKPQVNTQSDLKPQKSKQLLDFQYQIEKNTESLNVLEYLL